MRRIIMLGVVALVMAAMMVATAMPLFADAPQNGHNCGGVNSSGAAPEQQNHGQTGQAVSSAAQNGGLGEEVRAENAALANCGNNNP